MSAKAYSEAWLTGPQSTQFYTRTYAPATTPKAVIVFIHGFAEHVGRYTHFHPLLAKQGIAVFAIDQRGFGLTALDTEGKKSKTSAWGKTCWAYQMEDIDWAIKHAQKTFEDTPVFLMGHSMGGGEVLGFATQGDSVPNKSTAVSLAGVIATSPLITQTTPASKLVRWIGGKASFLAPWTLVATELNPGDLSHDEAFNNAYMKDPLIKLSGTLKGLNDMLSKGEALLRSTQRWPKTLPLLIVHGTQDKITSHKSSQAFVDLVSTTKKISLFEGGYHELQNEPDGVKERLAEEVCEFVATHVAQSTRAAKAMEAKGAASESQTAEPESSGSTASPPKPSL